MEPTGPEAAGTKERLLESACRVFADKGYRDATIAEICHEAGANNAAVNYHFGDKASLYVEAWRLAFQRSMEAHPPDGGVPQGAPAEERLRGRVLALMHRMLDQGSHEFDIMHSDMVNPTGLLEEAKREVIEPVRQAMAALVREFLGPDAPDRDVHLCQISILAQCFHTMLHRRRLETRSEPRPAYVHPDLEFSVEMMADHIVRFSLGGIGAIRRQAENGGLGDLE